MFAASKTSSSNQPDPQFNYVTMLLHGDGTNGAQNNTFLDSSTNAFSITRNGNTTQGSFSPYGSNWSNFNPDSSNGLGVATNTALNMGTGDFTVEAWVNTAKLPTTNAFQTSSGGYQCVFGTGPSNSSSGTQLYIGVTNLKFDISSDGGGPIDVAHNMVAGQWYHVAISRSSTTFKAFINGVLVQTATSSSSWVDGYNYGLMRAEPIGSYDGAWWYGYVSNFRLIKGTAIYTSSFTPSTTPLTAISGTSLLTCQSNRFIDNSSNNFTISVNNSPSVQRFNPFGTSTAYDTSVIGGSGYFDGSGDYLTIGSSGGTAVGTSDFTVAFWIYLTNTSVTQIDYRPASTNGAYITIGLTANTSIDYTVGGSSVITSSTAPTLNAWSYIAVSRVSGSTRLFINGVQVGSTYADSTNYLASNGNIWWNAFIGARPGTGYVAGYILVKTGLYSTTFTPPTTPPTAITNTQTLLNFTNGAIFDNAMMNDLETVGNAQISTSVVKYGTGSLKFNGTTDYLAPPANSIYAFNTGNFTVEAWVYLNASQEQLVFDTRSSASTAGFGCRIGPDNKLYYSDSANNALTTTTITNGTWTHIAWVRNGSTLTGYINGVSGGTATNTNNITQNNGVVGKVGFASSGYFNGYIDDLRITKGVARYTANFTPPTAAFSNTGPI